MKKILLITIALILMYFFSSAQTNISGGNVSGIWALTNSPYIINGNIQVPKDSVLIIEPGVIIKFNDSLALQIDGTLIARGKDTSKIIFTSNTKQNPGVWAYIYFTNISTDASYDINGNYISGCILEYCIVRYAGGSTVNNIGAIRLDGAHPFINYCSISDNNATGICANNLSNKIIFSNNIIVNNNNNSGNGGGILVSGGDVSINNNTLSKNTAGGYGGGIYSSGSTMIIKDNLINYNLSSYGGGGGIYIHGGDITIIGNKILNNDCNAPPNVWVHGGGGIRIDGGTVSIINNNISNNTNSGHGGGINILGGTITINNNIIAKNTCQGRGGGIHCYYVPIVKIENNIIIKNSTIDLGGGICATNSDNMLVSNNIIAYNFAKILNSSGVLGGIVENNAIINNSDSIGKYSNNTFIGFDTNGDNSITTLDTFFHNNVLNNIIFKAVNDTGSPINATGNYWGTTNLSEIQAKIYDWYDDSSRLVVNYLPYLNNYNITAPVSPPKNLRKMKMSGGKIKITWNPNLETDIAGYRIYFGGFNGYSFSNSIDVGNNTSYILSGVSFVDTIGVTAYDNIYSPLNEDPSTIVNDNMTNGNESWYAYAEFSGHNAGVNKIISPDSIIPVNTISYPKAIIKNFGLVTDTIPVNFSVDTFYSADTSIVLLPNKSDTLSFKGWLPTKQGTFIAKCKTILVSDEVYQNDSILKNIVVSTGNGPEIYRITPNQGGNTGSVTVKIVGTGFEEGAVVRLTRKGQQDIVPDTSVTKVIDSNEIITVFNLDGKALGTWNLVITNPDSSSTTFNKGFEIEKGNKLLWANIIGNNRIRIGSEQMYLISYGNAGNIDVESPEIIIWFPKDCIGKLSEKLSDTAFIIDTSLLQTGYSSDNIGFLAILPRLSAGVSGILYFKLTAPGSLKMLSLNVRIADDLYMIEDSSLEFKKFKKSFSGTGQTYDVCSKIFFKLFFDKLIPLKIDKIADHPILILPEFDEKREIKGHRAWTQISYIDYDILISNDATSLEKTVFTDQNYNVVGDGCVQLTFEEINCLAEKLNYFESHTTKHEEQPFKQPNKRKFDCIGILEYCAELCNINNHNGFIDNSLEKNHYEGDLWRLALKMRAPRNNKLIFAQDNDMENKRKDPFGTLFIYAVRSMDPNDKAGPVGYGNLHYILPEEPVYYIIHFENVDSATAPAENILITDTLDANLDWSSFSFVDVSHLPKLQIMDTVKGIAKWVFDSINLPPNVNPPEGEGWVMFKVNQKSGLPTGTQIKNKAYIKFDYNPPMITNEFLNTIDTGAPNSAVKLQPKHIDSTSYLISWSGQDDNFGSGIKDYTIYYSKLPDSAYVKWIKTSDTSAIFTGIKDTTYYFYSIARDNVGHIEPNPALYDLALTVRNNSIENDKIKIYPNPSFTQITIEWDNPNNEPFTLKLFDIIGNNLVHIEGIKTSKYILDIRSLESGVYIIKLFGNKIHEAKLLKL